MWLLGCVASGPFLDPGVVLVGPPQVAQTGATVTLEARTAGTGTVVWDLGDGTERQGRTIEHTWSEPGRVRISASLGDAQASTTVQVVNPPLAEPPVQSSRLAVAGDVLWVALRDRVVKVDRHADTVETLDTCEAPTALSLAPDASLLVVVCEHDEVLWVGPDGQVAQRLLLPWGSRPQAVVQAPQGTFALLSGTGEIARVTPEGVDVLAQGLVEPRGLVAGPDGLATVGFVSPDTHGRWWTVGWDGQVTEHALARDEGPDSDTDARGVPTGLVDVALRPDGQALAIAGLKANTQAGLWREGTLLAHDNVARAVVRDVDWSGAEGTHPRLDNRDRARAVTYSPLGDVLFVAHHGAQVVDLLDPVTLQRMGGLQHVGAGAEALWSDGQVVWVLLGLDGQLASFQVRLDGQQVELERIQLVDPAELDTPEARGRTLFHASADPRMTTDAYISCASCHWEGGHDGRTWDFTQRGEGLRNTLPLWAMPADGPFHWSANFDELQDFENDIRLHQAGDGYLSDADWEALQDPLGAPKAGASVALDDLAAYLEELVGQVPRSPWRTDEGRLTDAALRGAQVFHDQGCAGCHPAGGSDAGWVDGEPILHDVGTLTQASGQRMGEALVGLRTPPLYGLHASAPYLHDGSAPTVADALVAHGIEPDPDLIEYLLQLED